MNEPTKRSGPRRDMNVGMVDPTGGNVAHLPSAPGAQPPDQGSGGRRTRDAFSYTENPENALPQDGADRVRRGLELYERQKAENDRLAAELLVLQRRLKILEVECSAWESRCTGMEGDVQRSRHERDQAVGERAIWEALFAGIRAQLDTFNPPSQPLALPKR